MIYELFLQKYPDNDFADDARISIENLGKTPEELIKQFEEQQQANQEQ
jgi:inosine/xanthosine triphosphate pyrophosphatase family protein